METEEVTLPRVEVDTNHYYASPSSPQIPATVVSALGLWAGQQVTAYMPPDPEDVWEGVVRHDPSLPEQWQWWVEIG